MSKVINPLVHAGDAISHRAGTALIVLTCVRPGYAYRVAVEYPSTGAEVAELSASYPDEGTARYVARDLSGAFRAGLTITQAVAA